MPTKDDSITISPDGTVYHTGRGTEDMLENNGYMYATKPVIGRYAKGFTERGDHAEGKVDTTDTVLLAALRNHATAVRSAGPALAPAMVKAAPEGVANSDNIELLQLIRLHPELQAKPELYFYLEEAFVTRDIPHLEYKEDFRDVTTGPRYIDRLERIPATDLKYDQIVYSLKKLADKVYVPYEDIWRTIINPVKADYEQIRWAFQWKRNQSALDAIKLVANETEGTATNPNLGKVELFGSDSPYHSKNHAAKELMVMFNKFLKDNDVSITHTIMNDKLFAELTENTWTKSGPNDIAPQRPNGGGVFPFPGIANLTAIVDVHVPDNKIYAINKPNALRLGEGPKVLRRYEDPEVDAMAIRILDFHQHLAVNDQLTKIDRRFGMTINVTA